MGRVLAESRLGWRQCLGLWDDKCSQPGCRTPAGAGPVCLEDRTESVIAEGQLQGVQLSARACVSLLLRTYAKSSPWRTGCTSAGVRCKLPGGTRSTDAAHGGWSGSRTEQPGSLGQPGFHLRLTLCVPARNGVRRWSFPAEPPAPQIPLMALAHAPPSVFKSSL